MRQKVNMIAGLLIVIGLAFGTVGPALGEMPKARSGVEVPSVPLPAANDFATTGFGNAWDMNEFSDISQYLNGAGRYPNMADIKVENSVFSARSVGDYTGNIAFFYPLFGGYEGFMQIGRNLGSVKAVDPQQYQCFYAAMKVNSPDQKVPNGPQSDVFRIFWKEGPSGKETIGGTFVYLYPETLSPTNRPLVHNWKLYKVDLNDPPNGLYPGNDTPWSQNSNWTGIEINPTIFKNTQFEIDWIRLTSCEDSPEHQAQIEWKPDRNINAVWVQPAGTQRNILAASGIDGNKGSYRLDTKGLTPGSYKVGLGSLSDCCSQWSDGTLKINQPPVVQFQRPSPSSGEDYATSAGNPWDMDPSDITRIDCSQAQFEDGILQLNTSSPSGLSAGCRGSIGEADSQLFLNLPETLMVAGQYRYLSFRHYINGNVPMPADGMMGRWIWTATNECTRVSADIPYDVGWHTYSIDLYDAFNGTPVNTTPGCDAKPWREAGQVIRLRFDPNENWTGNLVPAMNFHQELDWIRLTRVDRVARGSVFPIQISLHKPVEQLRSINYFYTTDRQSPRQHPIQLAASPRPDPGMPSLYLPFISRLGSGTSNSGVNYSWDTSGVAAGEYYICAEANDGFNETIFCSEAPVQVYNR